MRIKVRVCLKNAAFIGDNKYGLVDAGKTEGKGAWHRLFLHAAQLNLMDPSTQQHIQIKAPYDFSLRKTLRLQDEGSLDW